MDSRRFRSPIDPAVAAAAARIVRDAVARHLEEDEAQTSLLVDCRAAGPDMFPFFRGLLARGAARLRRDRFYRLDAAARRSFSRRPAAYARVVFAATDRLSDGFVTGVAVALRPQLRDKVVSLRTAGGLPTLALARLGFRRNCLPADARADYELLLDDEDTL